LFFLALVLLPFSAAAQEMDGGTPLQSPTAPTDSGTARLENSDGGWQPAQPDGHFPADDDAGETTGDGGAANEGPEFEETIPEPPQPFPPQEPDGGPASMADKEDDEIILIDDGEDQGEGLIEIDGEDDLIIVLDEETPLSDATAPRQVSGALGSLWEALHVGADWRVLLNGQQVAVADRPLRSRGDGWIESFADFYEAYAKISAPQASVLLGRLVIPWGHTQVAALGDRLNPPDHRRGPQLPVGVAGRQPQWGAWLKTSLGSMAVEAVALFNHEPTQGGLAASEQGGIRLGHHQGALVRSPARAGGLLAQPQRGALEEGMPLGESGSLGLRARQRVGDFDLGGSAVLSHDPVPTLKLDPALARYLGAESIRRAFPEQSTAPIPWPCPGGAFGAQETLETCFSQGASLTHAKTTSFTLDGVWGLGLVILKGEVLAQPRLGQFGGKTAHLLSVQGLHSMPVNHYGASLAAEGALGDWLGGSLEVYDRVWEGIPANSTLHGIEPFGENVGVRRTVHRLAAGAALTGMALDDRLIWHLRGEGGLLQGDVLMGADVRYRIPFFNLYVGGQGNLFTGNMGSPGWFFQEASYVGVYLGEGG
jgi:hypothetical protein